MSGLLKAIDNPPLSVYPVWTRLDDYGVPKVDPVESMKQPEKIKVTYTMNGRGDPDENRASQTKRTVWSPIRANSDVSISSTLFCVHG